jgi:hypothetical protein
MARQRQAEICKEALLPFYENKKLAIPSLAVLDKE